MKSKGLSDEAIKPPDNSLAPILGYANKSMYLEFNRRCLKQSKIIYDHGKIVNMCIVCDLKSTLNYNEDFTLKNCLFRAVRLIKNADFNKYKYYRYGIGFDEKGVFSHPTSSLVKNATIFRADTSSSNHIDNKKADILILGKGPT